MNKVAVTGGAGFVGSNLVRGLLEHGFDVVVIDDFSTGLQSNLRKLDCVVRELSITDPKLTAKALKDCSTIFHLAARGSVPRSIRNPRATFDVNVEGTINVLESARDIGAKFIFSSSSSVYGANMSLPKDEEMFTAPLTPYAASKLAGEGLVQSYSSSYGIQAICFRFFNIFGPAQRPDHDYAAVIPKWIWKLMHSEEIEVFGDGNQSRDFTYVDTVVETLLYGMKSNMNHPRPINLAFGSTITLNDTIMKLRRHFSNAKVNYLADRQGDVKYSENNPAKVKSMFPSISPVSFDEGLNRTIEWFKKYGATIANGPKVLD